MALRLQNPRMVQTKINYFHDTGKPLVPMVIGGSAPAVPQPKVSWPVTITDVTGNESLYTLDKQGFQYVKHNSQLETWDNDEEIRMVHYPEMENLAREVLLKVKNLPPPSSIHILTHIIRRGAPDGEVTKPAIGPLYGVHVDQSLAAAPGVAQRWLGDAAPELLKKSYQIINMWRPLRLVTRDPFAVSDARSILDSDIVTVPIIFPDHHTEALEVRPPPEDRAHLWYYKDNQQPDDVLFFMQVDSRENAAVDIPRRVPHCAFKNPDLPNGAGEPRISIEVRALVFYDCST